MRRRARLLMARGETDAVYGAEHLPSCRHVHPEPLLLSWLRLPREGQPAIAQSASTRSLLRTRSGRGDLDEEIGGWSCEGVAGRGANRDEFPHVSVCSGFRGFCSVVILVRKSQALVTPPVSAISTGMISA